MPTAQAPIPVPETPKPPAPKPAAPALANTGHIRFADTTQRKERLQALGYQHVENKDTGMWGTNARGDRMFIPNDPAGRVRHILKPQQETTAFEDWAHGRTTVSNDAGFGEYNPLRWAEDRLRQISRGGLKGGVEGWADITSSGLNAGSWALGGGAGGGLAKGGVGVGGKLLALVKGGLGSFTAGVGSGVLDMDSEDPRWPKDRFNNSEDIAAWLKQKTQEAEQAKPVSLTGYLPYSKNPNENYAWELQRAQLGAAPWAQRVMSPADEYYAQRTHFTDGLEKAHPIAEILSRMFQSRLYGQPDHNMVAGLQ